MNLRFVGILHEISPEGEALVDYYVGLKPDGRGIWEDDWFDVEFEDFGLGDVVAIQETDNGYEIQEPTGRELNLVKQRDAVHRKNMHDDLSEISDDFFEPIGTVVE